MFLRDAIVFETIGDQDKQYERAALALKVAFNLCNDYGESNGIFYINQG